MSWYWCSIKAKEELEMYDAFDIEYETSKEFTRIEKIADCAFTSKEIESISIGNSIINIGNQAITNLVLPNNIETINGYAFENNLINNVTIGNGIRYLGKCTFKNNNISSFKINIPESNKQIVEFSNAALEDSGINKDNIEWVG